MENPINAKGLVRDTHPGKESQTKMAFDIPSEVLGKVMDKIFFINTSGFLPFILLIPPDSFSQILRKQPVGHPLFCISPFHSHLLQPYGRGLQICLLQQKFMNLNITNIIEKFHLNR